MTAQDYYPFGMMSRVALPNSGVPYKFGFNGKWNDNDVKGLGLQQDYGMRIYDPRVGRFLSVDPLTRSFPHLTPYQFASNTPIQAIDLDGEEAQFVVHWLADKAKAMGYPKISGIIGTLGGVDPWHNATQLGSKVLNGDFKGAAKQVAGYSPAGMLYNIGKNLGQTGVTAMNGKEEEGEVAKGTLIGIGGQVLLFHTLSGGGVVDEPVAATNPGVVEEPVAATNNQATAANSGNSQAAANNTGFNRPSWQQTEADVVTSDYREQVAFKNGNEVPKNTRGSVRPEGYKPGDAIEAKNYSLTTEKGIQSLIRNVTKQVKQRQANLPANSVQNIVVDVRGQGLRTSQLMKIRSRLTTQTGSKNINVTFRTD